MATRISLSELAASGKKRSGLKKKQVRILNKKESKVVENPKKAMFIRGPKTSNIVNKLLTDLVTKFTIIISNC
jgi:hypothetical protein